MAQMELLLPLARRLFTCSRHSIGLPCGAGWPMRCLVSCTGPHVVDQVWTRSSSGPRRRRDRRATKHGHGGWSAWSRRLRRRTATDMRMTGARARVRLTPGTVLSDNFHRVGRAPLHVPIASPTADAATSATGAAGRRVQLAYVLLVRHQAACCGRGGRRAGRRPSPGQ